MTNLFYSLYDSILALINFPGSSPMSNFVFILLVLTLLSILCVIKIIIYFISIVVLQNPKYISWFSLKFPSWFLQLLKFFSSLRIYYIVFEVLIYIYINSIIIYLCTKYLVYLG